MAQAKIYWDLENYAVVERIFQQSADFCYNHEDGKLNVAHVFFMQEKFKNAIPYYEATIKKHESILDVKAIVLANLCVSYIMINQNGEAEELMRQIEKEEERISLQPEHENKQSYHLCIVNLVIGTLYCAKNNFEFGIVRIIKSLEPYRKKLGPDTWYHTKRCFLALLDALSRQMLTLQLKDELYHQIITFLDGADEHGKKIPVSVQGAATTSASSAAAAAAAGAAGVSSAANGGGTNLASGTSASTSAATGTSAPDGKTAAPASGTTGSASAAAVNASVVAAAAAAAADPSTQTVSYEARLLKRLFLRLRGH